MGFQRIIGRAGLVLAAVLSAAPAAPAPREPLIVTELSDPETELEVTVAASAVDGDIEAFSRAVRKAVRLQQQAIAEKCRSQVRGSGTIGARWRWEASCRYLRR